MRLRLFVIFLFCLSAAALAVSPARAQDQSTSDIMMGTSQPFSALPSSAMSIDLDRPKIVKDKDVALVYYGLVFAKYGIPPDFDAIAVKTDEWLKARDLDKDRVKEQQVALLSSAFNDMHLNEPIVVRMLVHLSKYSEKNSGFVVTDFQEQTYFKYSFAGSNFLIVPQGLLDHQFIGPFMSLDAAKPLMHGGAGRTFHMLLYLMPNYADKPETMTQVDGTLFHVISAPVSFAAIYDNDDRTRLWWDKPADTLGGQASNPLLNLKVGGQ